MMLSKVLWKEKGKRKRKSKDKSKRKGKEQRKRQRFFERRNIRHVEQDNAPSERRKDQSQVPVMAS